MVAFNCQTVLNFVVTCGLIYADYVFAEPPYAAQLPSQGISKFEILQFMPKSPEKTIDIDTSDATVHLFVSKFWDISFSNPYISRLFDLPSTTLDFFELLYTLTKASAVEVGSADPEKVGRKAFHFFQKNHDKVATPKSFAAAVVTTIGHYLQCKGILTEESVGELAKSYRDILIDEVSKLAPDADWRTRFVALVSGKKRFFKSVKAFDAQSYELLGRLYPKVLLDDEGKDKAWCA